MKKYSHFVFFSLSHIFSNAQNEQFNICNRCKTFKDKARAQKGELIIYHKTDEQEIQQIHAQQQQHRKQKRNQTDL